MHSGVAFYKSGIVPIPVHFPEGKMCCQYCAALKYERGYERYHCMATGEWIVEPRNQLGFKCPIIFGKEEAENGN